MKLNQWGRTCAIKTKQKHDLKKVWNNKNEKYSDDEPTEKGHTGGKKYVFIHTPDDDVVSRKEQNILFDD